MATKAQLRKLGFTDELIEQHRRERRQQKKLMATMPSPDMTVPVYDDEEGAQLKADELADHREEFGDR